MELINCELKKARLKTMKKNHQEVLITSSFFYCLQISLFRLGLKTKLKFHVLSTKFRLFSVENTIQTNTNITID